MGWKKKLKKIGKAARNVASDVVGAYTGGMVNFRTKKKEHAEPDYRADAATKSIVGTNRQGGSGQVKFKTEEWS